MNAKDISIIVGACLAVVTALGGGITFIIRGIMKQQADRFDNKFDAAIDTKTAEIERLRAEFERQIQRLENENFRVKKENESLDRQKTFFENRLKNFPARAIIEKAISETDEVAKYLVEELKSSENKNDFLDLKVSELNDKLNSLREQLMALANLTEKMVASNAASTYLLNDENRHTWVEDACRVAVNNFSEISFSEEEIVQLRNDIDQCLFWVGQSLRACREVTEPPILAVIPHAKNSEIHQFIFNWIKNYRIKNLPLRQAQEVVFYLDRLAVIFA